MMLEFKLSLRTNMHSIFHGFSSCSVDRLPRSLVRLLFIIAGSYGRTWRRSEATLHICHGCCTIWTMRSVMSGSFGRRCAVEEQNGTWLARTIELHALCWHQTAKGQIDAGGWGRVAKLRFRVLSFSSHCDAW